MRRFDKNQHIQKLNETLNNKKTSLVEFFKPGEGSEREYYDHILQGETATEEEAYEHARNMDWSAVQLTTMKLPNAQYFDTINGIDIYHDRPGDYFLFAPAEEEMEGPKFETYLESEEAKENLLNEGTTSMFERLCGLKLKK